MKSLYRIALAPLVFCLLAATPTPTPKPGMMCLPPGVEKTDDTPAPLTGEQIKAYAIGLESPEVLGMRNAFDAFASGHTDPSTARALKSYKTLVSDKFFVWKVESAIVGGSIFQILFKDHLGAVYRVWTFQLPSGLWQVRSFEQLPCTQAQVQWIVHKYRRIFTERFGA